MTGYVLLLLLGALETRWPLYAFIVSLGLRKALAESLSLPRRSRCFMVPVSERSSWW
jgi:hypothetical protein